MNDRNNNDRTSEGEHNLEVLWERVSWMRDNMEERRVELLRRLDELNHAHAQAQERNRTYIPRETFDQKIDSMQRAVDIQNNDFRMAIDGIRKLLYMGVGIVLALQGLLWIFIMMIEQNA